MQDALPPPLAGLRVIESAILAPAAITTAFADLGAEVVKVETPAGDYIREMTWPIIEGVSLMHYHLNRGKKSIALDLKNEAAREVYRDLVRGADVVIEGSKPGALARWGLGYDDLRAVNPKIVFCTISGYGTTGPYKDMPSHGIAYDTWSGVVKPAYDEQGFCHIAEHVAIGIGALINAGFLLRGLLARGTYRPAAGWGAFGLKVLLANAALAAVLLWAAETVDWIGLQGAPLLRAAWLAAVLAGVALLYFAVLAACGLRLRQFMRRG